MRTLLLLADIHANLPALTAVLKVAGPVDFIVNAGDIVDYGPWPLETIELVKQINCLTVMGNHDRDCAIGSPVGYNPYARRSCLWTYHVLGDEERAYLLGLPQSGETVQEDVKVAVYHGSPRDPLDEYVLPDYPAMVFTDFIRMAHAQVLVLGHTHLPFHKCLPDGSHIVNPGSVGQPRDGDPRASYVLVRLNEAGVMEVTHARVAYDVPQAAEGIIRAGLPSFLAERLYSGI